MTRQLFLLALSSVFYISSTILVLNSWVIKISFVTTILLGVTTLLKITNSLEIIVFLAKITYFVKSIYVKSANIECINARVAKSADVGSSWVGSTCIKTFYTKSRNFLSKDSYIYSSIYKSSKSFVWDSRLLAELTFEIFVSFYLYLWIILNKVL